MKENELQKRIDILERKTIPQITRMSLQGGMQERLHRQELIKYGRDIEKQKTKFKTKLSKLRKDKESRTQLQGQISSLIAQETQAMESSQESGDTFSISASIASERRSELENEFGLLTTSIESPLGKFHEPRKRRVRSRRGFFLAW